MKKFNKMTRAMLTLCLVVMVVFMAKTPAAAASKYWIKVNKQANVATVYQYKNKEWTPKKAFLISCGGSHTPAGTFYTGGSARWGALFHNCYGQYTTHITGNILFHSVWFYYNGDPTSQSVEQFNKLGSTASAGCVRLATGDAKWIYDNCPENTKVTIYSSSNPGPLGKPAGYKMPAEPMMNWDPTDPDTRNPYYKTLPVLKQKYEEVKYKSGYKAKELVTAKQKDGSALKNLKTYTLKWDSNEGGYVKATFSTKKPGVYKIKYTATSTMDVKLVKTFKIRVLKKGK